MKFKRANIFYCDLIVPLNYYQERAESSIINFHKYITERGTYYHDINTWWRVLASFLHTLWFFSSNVYFKKSASLCEIQGTESAKSNFKCLKNGKFLLFQASEKSQPIWILILCQIDWVTNFVCFYFSWESPLRSLTRPQH